jgi:predicted enzyme related to lactoylglutathione lyase
MEVELRVRGVDAALGFYRDVIGVPFGDAHSHEEGGTRHSHAEWGEWGEDGFLLLSLYPAEPGKETRSSIGFAVPEFDALHQRLSTEARVVQRPTQMPWGRSAAYEDADGNTVSITEEPG